jgi:hypothetical protein
MLLRATSDNRKTLTLTLTLTHIHTHTHTPLDHEHAPLSTCNINCHFIERLFLLDRSSSTTLIVRSK